MTLQYQKLYRHKMSSIFQEPHSIQLFLTLLIRFLTLLIQYLLRLSHIYIHFILESLCIILGTYLITPILYNKLLFGFWNKIGPPESYWHKSLSCAVVHSKFPEHINSSTASSWTFLKTFDFGPAVNYSEINRNLKLCLKIIYFLPNSVVPHPIPRTLSPENE